MTDQTPEPSPTLTIASFLTLAVVVIGGGVLMFVTLPQPVTITINPPEDTPPPQPTPTPGPILVYVTGAVANPETTVELPAGSRVAAALDAVGGPLDEADMARVNVADVLRDGSQVHVPLAEVIEQLAEADAAADTDIPAGVVTPEDVPQDVDLATPMGGELVNLNTATAEALATLPRIGDVTAQAIIDYREENGPFRSLDELTEVSGIGAATAQGLEGLVRFE